jgi:periplasmic divalent cation tolerance protein
MQAPESVGVQNCKFMMEQAKVIVAFTTCPDEKVGVQISNALVEEGLAACVNRVPGVVSTYIWGGTVQEDQEHLLLIKTTEAQFDALKTRLSELHPYELPELIAIPVCAGAENYLDWVRHNVK